jgi:hypothetical protein
MLGVAVVIERAALSYRRAKRVISCIVNATRIKWFSFTLIAENAADLRATEVLDKNIADGNGRRGRKTGT